ncbi:hypothetical protein M514_05634 [Trichuris suis]|uniref:Uncharacterized protein n=1 Tax=Trichuris suis TaxID=68888 RepID=A0A085NQQ4_9BILA|nr:hypothetical protein M513_05634 [Trichuris suis]KFD71800.1 hypothetical protein M514_05634 [Trichuris suis]
MWRLFRYSRDTPTSGGSECYDCEQKLLIVSNFTVIIRDRTSHRRRYDKKSAMSTPKMGCSYMANSQ